MIRHAVPLVIVLLIPACMIGAPKKIAPPTAVRAPVLERFTVPSDGLPIAVWARRPAVPRGSVLLVHGRTWSGRPDFDLQVPGLQRSVLTSLAAQGYAAYAVDLRGYGETPRDETGWSTPRRAADDVLNILQWIAVRHPGLPLPALIGWSRGSVISMMCAQLSPTRMSALVLTGFALDPDEQLDVPETVSGEPLREKNTAANAASDFISPDVTSPAVVAAFVDQALTADPVHVDLTGEAEFSLLKPEKVTVPTLVLFGERDPGVPSDIARKFFAKLGTPDRQMIVLRGGDHASQLEETHEKWIAAVVNFLSRPPLRR